MRNLIAALAPVSSGDAISFPLQSCVVVGEPTVEDDRFGLNPQGMVQVCGLLRRPDKFARIRDTVTDFGLPEDTFFDCALLHLLTTATLDQLRGLYPDGRFEVRRFRPNIVVETAYGDRDFVENA